MNFVVGRRLRRSYRNCYWNSRPIECFWRWSRKERWRSFV